MPRWMFSRDVNMTLSNVQSFFENPENEAAGNPAARPSAFQDWGIWNTEERKPTEVGLALKNGQLSWRESILLLLSKRSSSTDSNGAVKPLVVICKTMKFLQPKNISRLSKSSCAKYLVPVESYSNVQNAAESISEDQSPEGENAYLDIWFNALVESQLFIYPIPRKKEIIEVAQSSYAHTVIDFIAIYGDKISPTPAKDHNKKEYYKYLGDMETGFSELITPLKTLTKELPTLCKFDSNILKQTTNSVIVDSQKIEILGTYLAAIRSKPFLLLAGISGTGKSRLVRQLAKATAGELNNSSKPGNYELIPVKPNWHDSTELLGYVSRILGTPEYVMTDFVKFLFKAYLYPEIPFFLCLDEMNLAPVEQYFAEYLSVIETRRKDTDGKIKTDILVSINSENHDSLKAKLQQEYKKWFPDGDFDGQFALIETDGGLRIPQNLIVIGTVNMDETTFSFSRKVLDRAMSFELNEVNMNEGILEDNTDLPAIPAENVRQSFLTANDVYKANPEIANAVLSRLTRINEALDNTPFKIAYRSRNEIMIYVWERIHDHIQLGEASRESIMKSSRFHQAMDEAVSMKILSRIEGDEQRIDPEFFDKLQNAVCGDIKAETVSAGSEAQDEENADAADENIPADNAADAEAFDSYPLCRKKLAQMQKQLKNGYVSFWS